MSDEQVDFTAEDRGGYKPPTFDDGHTYADLERRVLKALTDDNGAGDDRAFRTLPRIKEHAGLERRFDLSPVIEGMQIDKKIRRVDNGNITAFFLHKQRPSRFWLNGDRTVGAEFEQQPIRVGDDLKPAAVMPGMIRTETPVTIATEHGPDVDVDQIKDAATRLGKAQPIANELQIGLSTLWAKLNQQPQLLAAYKEGIAEHERLKRRTDKPSQNKRNPKEEQKTMDRTSNDETAAAEISEPAGETSHSAVKPSADQLREAVAEHGSMQKAAAALGLKSYSNIDYLIRADKSGEYRKAYDEGKAQFIEQSGKKTAASRGLPTYEQMFNAAKKVGTRDGTAKELGYSGKGSMNSIFTAEPRLKDAYNKGKEAFNAARSADREQDESGTVDALPESTKAVTEDRLAEAEDRQPTPEELDHMMANLAKPITEITRYPEAKSEEVDASDETKILIPAEDEVPNEIPHEAHEEHIASRFGRREVGPLDEAIVGGIFKAILTPKAPVSSHYVTFEKGGQLLVGFEGNLFDLSDDELALLEHVRDVFNAHEKAVHVRSIEAAAEKPQPTRWQRIKTWLNGRDL